MQNKKYFSRSSGIEKVKNNHENRAVGGMMFLGYRDIIRRKNETIK